MTTRSTKPTMSQAKMAHQRKHRTIDSKDSFVAEYRSLITDFNNSIGNLQQYQKNSRREPSKELIESLNRLKLHRKKLIDMLTLYTDVEQGKWVKVRPAAQDIFRSARQAWQRTGEMLSRPGASA